MNTRLSPFAIVGIVLLAAFTIFITWRAKKLELKSAAEVETSALIGEQAPEFSLETLGGVPISLSDYRKKKSVVVTFWASWCGPCRLELPELAEFYKKHIDSQGSFEILGISIDDEASDARDFASKANLPFPLLWDKTGSVARSYQVDSIPAMFVIDGEGKIIFATVGFSPGLDVILESKLGFLQPRSSRDGE
jgi:cytochrome c biogenesis protein CcmG, thiol:disulfide interchange protein DsbE